MKTAKWLAVAYAAMAAATATVTANAAEISGAGSTFAYPIYARWADAYKKQTGIGLNYQSIGSGAGIKQIKAGTVTFGASDMPLDAKDLDRSGLAQFPTVLGGVVAAINVAGIAAGSLVVDGPTLANIFAGAIAKWNDPAIARLNPNVKLPAQAIAVVHRADGSGTTFIFTDYLSKVSADWKSKVGASTAVEWPAGIGAKGNEGVAAMLAQTAGAIGYVEYAYAKQNKLNVVRLVNKDGKKVAPDANAFQAAAANADWSGTPGFAVILTDQPGANAWPIAGATFVLIHKRPHDPAAASAVLAFFDWAYAKGTSMAQSLDYVPLPPAVIANIRKMWARDITGGDGKPLFRERR